MLRRLLATLLTFTSLATAVQAEDEDVPLAMVLSCGTGADASEGFLSLEGQPVDGDMALATLQFVEESDGVAAEPWPADGASGPAQFFSSTSFGPEGAFTDIRFARDGQDWHIYIFTAPWQQDEPQDGAAGLVVLDADGKVVRSVPCAERMAVYFDVLEATTRCDTEGPLGRTACSGGEVHRTQPLATLYPWFTAP